MRSATNKPKDPKLPYGSNLRMNGQNQIKKSTNESIILSNNDMPLNQKSQSKYGSKPESVHEASKKQGGVSANSITFKPTLHTDDGDESLHECTNKSNIQLSW